MIRGETKSGFAFELRDDALNNWEILKALRAVDKGDVGAIVDVAPILMGEEQLKNLEEHMRRDGVIKADELIYEVMDMIQSCKEGKNS